MKTATFKKDGQYREKENSLISFSINVAETRVILEVFQIPTSTSPYVYGLQLTLFSGASLRVLFALYLTLCRSPITDRITRGTVSLKTLISISCLHLGIVSSCIFPSTNYDMGNSDVSRCLIQTLKVYHKGLEQWEQDIQRVIPTLALFLQRENVLLISGSQL